MYQDQEISTKILRLDGRLGRIGQDIIMEVNDNIVLIIYQEKNKVILDRNKLLDTINGIIFEQ